MGRSKPIRAGGWRGVVAGILFAMALLAAYTLSYGLWVHVAVKWQLPDSYAWIQDDFYRPLHWLAARSDWYGKLTGELFWWGYGPV